MVRSTTKREISSIMLQYGLHVHSVHPCRSLYNSSAGYHVVTSNGTVFLKPFKGLKTRLAHVHSRLLWLRENDFHHMPLWYTTRKGKYGVSYKGKLYYVSEWIEGNRLDRNEQEYERLGEVLGRLHHLTKQFVSQSSSLPLRECNRFKLQHKMFVHRLLVLKKKSNGIGKWFRDEGDRCRVLAEEAWRLLRQPDVRRALRNISLIHGDVTKPNVIVGSDEVYLVDWEFTVRGSAYYEVAKTLNNSTDFSIPHISAFLQGYQKINPLTLQERLIIAALFRLPREAWIASHRIIAGGKYADLFKGLKNSWAKRLEVIQWMDAWARQESQSGVQDLSSWI